MTEQADAQFSAGISLPAEGFQPSPSDPAVGCPGFWSEMPNSCPLQLHTHHFYSPPVPPTLQNQTIPHYSVCAPVAMQCLHTTQPPQPKLTQLSWPCLWSGSSGNSSWEQGHSSLLPTPSHAPRFSVRALPRAGKASVKTSPLGQHKTPLAGNPGEVWVTTTGAAAIFTHVKMGRSEAPLQLHQ